MISLALFIMSGVMGKLQYNFKSLMAPPAKIETLPRSSIKIQWSQILALDIFCQTGLVRLGSLCYICF